MLSIDTAAAAACGSNIDWDKLYRGIKGRFCFLGTGRLNE